MSSVNALIRRHWRLLVFILGLAFVFWLLWVLRSVLLPFIVGFLLAYLLLPIIRWVEKHLPGVGKKPKLKQLKRVSTLVVIYLLAVAVVGLTVFYVITDGIALMEESLKAVRTGDVPGKLMIGNGKFYLEIGTHLTVTQILIQEPVLKVEEKEEKADATEQGVQ